MKDKKNIMSTCHSSFIIGGYQTDFARNWHRENKHISAMMREAYGGAIEQTGIKPEDIDAVFVGNFASELYCRQGQLGGFCIDFDPCLQGLPTCRVEAGCASGALAVLNAMAYLNAGIYDVICVIGVEQMKTVPADKGGDYLGTAAWYEREANGIEFPFPKLFGRLGNVYQDRYGLNERYLARISEINYRNAKRNPNAQTRDWFMSYEHASSINEYNPVVGGMIKISDCSQVTDGAVCIFVASEAWTSSFVKSRGRTIETLPRILGWGHTTAAMGFTEKIANSRDCEYVLPFTRKAIVDAYARAGLSGCWDLDCIETHDCFTTSEYMAIDHFGLTSPGESWKAIEEGTIEPGGKLPINPSGGLIGCGHPVGATGVRQLLDAYKQVAGIAGEYQVEGAKKVGTLNIGGSATTNVSFVIGL
jgi:acetyl-CoA C-acetyltransferase